MYYSSPMDFFFGHPIQQRVLVVSDSEYQEYQQKKAEQEILVLESKKNRLLSAVKEYDLEIEKLQKEYPALLASSNESSN